MLRCLIRASKGEKCCCVILGRKYAYLFYRSPVQPRTRLSTVNVDSWGLKKRHWPALLSFRVPPISVVSVTTMMTTLASY